MEEWEYQGLTLWAEKLQTTALAASEHFRQISFRLEAHEGHTPRTRKVIGAFNGYAAVKQLLSHFLDRSEEEHSLFTAYRLLSELWQNLLGECLIECLEREARGRATILERAKLAVVSAFYCDASSRYPWYGC